MQLFRRMVGAAGLAVALVGVSACGVAASGAATQVAPAAARGGVWVQVSPTSISPGFNVQVRADCGDNSNSATVHSSAFGTITVQPWNTLLMAQVNIPASTKPGRFDVTITCRTGSSATTSITVIGSTAAPVAPANNAGPHTGGGYLAEHPTTNSGVQSGPLMWLGLAALSLVAAAATLVRSMTRRRRLAPARVAPARPGSAQRGSVRDSSGPRDSSGQGGSARLGSARLGSARLGSARLGSARGRSASGRSAWVGWTRLRDRVH
jgi:hypothetical protein